MCYYPKTNSDLKKKLYVELLLEYHPIYSTSPNRENLMERPGDYNIEHLVEQLFEYNCEGQYKFTDGIHEDFSDESECKTGTLHANGQASSAEITNVRSPAGILKKGSIRAVILNPILKKLHFFFIPKTATEKLISNRTTGKSMWLHYNKKKNEFTTLDKYGIIEFNTIKELAMEPNR